VYERYLDQASSLIQTSSRSSRQALGYLDLQDLPHRKRHHDEISSQEEKIGSNSKPPPSSEYPSKRYGNMITTLSNHQKNLQNVRRLIDDPRLLPTHPSHDSSSSNPLLKPHQILALTRDQSNCSIELPFYPRGNGKSTEREPTNSSGGDYASNNQTDTISSKSHGP
jgi:hypothetical protein